MPPPLLPPPRSARTHRNLIRGRETAGVAASAGGEQRAGLGPGQSGPAHRASPRRQGVGQPPSARGGRAAGRRGAERWRPGLQEGQLETLALLLKRNADPAGRSATGWTALHFAAGYGGRPPICTTRPPAAPPWAVARRVCARPCGCTMVAWRRGGGGRPLRVLRGAARRCGAGGRPNGEQLDRTALRRSRRARRGLTRFRTTAAAPLPDYGAVCPHTDVPAGLRHVAIFEMLLAAGADPAARDRGGRSARDEVAAEPA